VRVTVRPSALRHPAGGRTSEPMRADGCRGGTGTVTTQHPLGSLAKVRKRIRGRRRRVNRNSHARRPPGCGAVSRGRIDGEAPDRIAGCPTGRGTGARVCRKGGRRGTLPAPGAHTHGADRRSPVLEAAAMTVSPATPLGTAPAAQVALTRAMAAQAISSGPGRSRRVSPPHRRRRGDPGRCRLASTGGADFGRRRPAAAGQGRSRRSRPRACEHFGLRAGKRRVRTTACPFLRHVTETVAPRPLHKSTPV